MITNDGKNILAKYLISQVPTYASHIAIGCGAEPLLLSNNLEDYSNKKTLDFEMFRVPIVSRGYVEEDGVSKIVFTGELPSEERYEITEIGVFSSGSNVNAGSGDSKILFSFSSAENWEFHDTVNDLAQQVDFVLEPLNSENSSFINSEYDSTAFAANSTNGVFDTDIRLSIQERPRLLDSSVFISGNTCQIEETAGGDLQLLSGSLSKHVHYTNISLEEVAQNSSNDIIKTAFSIVAKEASLADTGPDEVKIILEFLSSEESGATLARIPIVYESTDFEFNRYIVNETTIGNMKGKENGFTWQGVNVARIYASIEKEYGIASATLTDSNTKIEFTTSTNHGFAVGSKVNLTGVSGISTLQTITDVGSSTPNKFKIAGITLPTLTSAKAKAPTSNYLIAMDGVRLDNVSTPNSLYALTAYSPIVNLGNPIVKTANSSNVVEFRFAMSVGGENVGPES